MASSPARKVTGRTHPKPLVLGAPAPTPEMLSREEPATPPVAVLPAPEPVAPTVEPTELPDEVTAEDTPTMTLEVTAGEMFIKLLNEHGRKIDSLTEAVRIVGQQQQWTTDTFVALRQDFDRMMSGGNPLKMIGQLLNPGQNRKATNG